MKKTIYISLIIVLYFFCVNKMKAQTIDVSLGLSWPIDMVHNGNDIYIAEESSNKISKIDITASLPTTTTDVVTGLNNPNATLVINSELYIAESNASKISKFILSPLSIKGFSIENRVEVYPNPTTEAINIDLGETLSNTKATLTNSLGQIIITKKYTATNSINIDIDAPNGIYFLHLEFDGGILTKKIIKE